MVSVGNNSSVYPIVETLAFDQIGAVGKRQKTRQGGLSCGIEFEFTQFSRFVEADTRQAGSARIRSKFGRHPFETTRQTVVR